MWTWGTVCRVGPHRKHSLRARFDGGGGGWTWMMCLSGGHGAATWLWRGMARHGCPACLPRLWPVLDGQRERLRAKMRLDGGAHLHHGSMVGERSMVGQCPSAEGSVGKAQQCRRLRR